MSDAEPVLFDFDSFDPDRSALFNSVRVRVDDAMLRVIANADDGAGFDAYYSGLRAAVETGEFESGSLKWGWSALSIVSCCDPYSPQDNYFETAERCHLGRMFAASAILRCGADERGLCDDFSHECIVLVESASGLGEPYIGASIRSLVWCGRHANAQDGGQLLFALAIIALWPFSSSTATSLRQIMSLIDGVQAWTDPLFEEHLCRIGRIAWRRTIGASDERVRELSVRGVIERHLEARYRKLIERIENRRD